jgi:hypothetical protein
MHTQKYPKKKSSDFRMRIILTATILILGAFVLIGMNYGAFVLIGMHYIDNDSPNKITKQLDDCAKDNPYCQMALSNPKICDSSSFNSQNKQEVVCYKE